MDEEYYQDNPDDSEDVIDMWQESCWHIVSSYFEEKGLVGQQLDSFDEFIQVRNVDHFRLACRPSRLP